MRFGILLLAAMAICSSRGGTLPELLEAVVNPELSPELLEAVANSGEKLNSIMQKYVDAVVSPAIKALEDRINSINMNIEGIQEEDQRVTRSTLEEMINARKELHLIRATLEALASDTIFSSNRLKRLISKISPNENPERIKKIAGRTAVVLSGLIKRSVGLLSEAKEKLTNIEGRLSKVEAHLKYLKKRLTSILNKGSEEHGSWAREIRMIVYLPMSWCPPCLIIAAPIVETKINKAYDALKERERAVGVALNNVEPLITKLNTLDGEIEAETRVVILWESKIDTMKDDFKDSDSVVDLIDLDGKDIAIEMLDSLIDVCQQYLDLKKE